MSIQSVGEILDIPDKADIEKASQMSFRERRQMIIDIENQIPGNRNEEDGYNCELCKNRGYIWKLNEDDMDTRVDCKCILVRNTLTRAKRSGLGDILSDFTFDKFKASEQWQIDLKNKAQAFCKDDSAKWFFIGGQVGCGKSHLCTAIAAHYIKAGLDVQYMVWVEDSKPLKALVNDIGYQEAVNKFKNVDVLYIDDFLKTQQGEQPTKGDINLAFEILNRRLLNPEQITIISSEKTMSDLLGYDEGTMSRIYKLCGLYKTDIEKDIRKNYRLRD